jgi:hypothetical protein
VVLFIAFSSSTHPQSSILNFGGQPVLTPAFSQNLLFSLGERIFGSIKTMMIILTSFGLLLHLLILYSLLQKNIKNGLKKHYGFYWAVLFLPYLLMLLFSVKV